MMHTNNLDASGEALRSVRPAGIVRSLAKKTAVKYYQIQVEPCVECIVITECRLGGQVREEVKLMC